MAFSSSLFFPFWVCCSYDAIPLPLPAHSTLPLTACRSPDLCQYVPMGAAPGPSPSAVLKVCLCHEDHQILAAEVQTELGSCLVGTEILL